MTKKERKEMLTVMKEKFILVSQSAGRELAFLLANELGKGYYLSHKKENQKSV